MKKLQKIDDYTLTQIGSKIHDTKVLLSWVTSQINNIDFDVVGHGHYSEESDLHAIGIILDLIKSRVEQFNQLFDNLEEDDIFDEKEN